MRSSLMRNEIPGKKGETILAEQEIALLSRRLATIQLDVDFPKEESFFQLKVPDLEKVKAFYHEMRFLSLLREMGTETRLHRPQREWTRRVVLSITAVSMMLRF